MSQENAPTQYVPQPRKVGMLGEVNNFVSNTVKELGNSTSTTLRSTRKVLSLAEIALDEATVDMQESYLLRKLEVQANLTNLGYSEEQVASLLTYREP